MYLNSYKFNQRVVKCLCLIGMGFFLLAGKCLAKEEPDSIQKLVNQAIAAVKPSLVRIQVVITYYEQGKEKDTEVAGSGVIINKEGFLVTNHHVAGKAKRIICTLSNKEEIEGKLVGTDPLSDISVIRLLPPKKRGFPFARFGDSSRLRVGDHILAMGSPYALSQSVTKGIISNTGLVMPDLFWPFNKMTMDGEDIGTLVRWIGHDAAIYGGNSGGPLVNLSGEVVGINEIRLGLSGAIPSNIVKEVTEQIIKHGKVRRSWLGLVIQPLLKSSGYKKGVLVSATIKGSSAEKAGFLPGDVLLQLDKNPTNVQFTEELPLFNQYVAKIPIGKKVSALVLRDDRKINLAVTTEEREPARMKKQELKEWGICGSDLSLLTSREMERENRDGVLVRSTRSGGPSDDAKPAIVSDDIILSVAGKPIKKIEDLVKLTEELTKNTEKPLPVLVGFERKSGGYLTVVKIGIQKPGDSGREATKAWLPVATQVITREIAKKLSFPNITGVRVTQVYLESTAEKAGLKKGDLIIAVDGESIPASNPEDSEVLPTMIRQYKSGTEVELTVLRDQTKEKIKVALASSPRLNREMKKYRDEDFGFTARDSSFQDLIQNKMEKKEGVTVRSVEEGSWAALGRLAVGDFILQVDGKSLTDVTILESLMRKLKADKPKMVVFQIQRGIYLYYLELEPFWPKEVKN